MRPSMFRCSSRRRFARPTRAVLESSPLFVEWAKAVRSDLRVSLLDQAGEIACEPLLEPVDPELWRALFPPDTTIASWQLPTLGTTQVAQLRRAAGARHRAQSALGHDVLRLHEQAEPGRSSAGRADPARVRRFRRTSELAFRMPDESRVTAQLDDILESGQSLEAIEHGVAGEPDAMRRMLLELHRCRRFTNGRSSRRNIARARFLALPFRNFRVRAANSMSVARRSAITANCCEGWASSWTCASPSPTDCGVRNGCRHG